MWNGADNHRYNCLNPLQMDDNFFKVGLEIDSSISI